MFLFSKSPLRRSLLMVGVCLWALMFHGTQHCQAQCTVFFDNENDFLLSTSSPSLESFESLVATNMLGSSSLVTPSFTITATMPILSGLGVFDSPNTGGFATDGEKWVGYESNAGDTMTFVFNSEKNAFGINITDWGDFGIGTLTFMNDAGDSFVVSVSPNPNGNLQFFGVINYNFPFTSVMFTQDIQGEFYGVDEVYCELVDNPTLSCKDINVSLNQECEVLVVPQMVITGRHDCADDYLVEIEYHNKPVPNPVDSSFLWKTLQVKVTNPATGNSCWSNMTIEDKLPPVITCRDDTMNCIEFKSYRLPPLVEEPCGTYTLRKLDERVTPMNCDVDFIQFVTRKYVAVDNHGNMSDTCYQSLWIERVRVDSVECPVEDTTIYCDSNFDRDPITGNPLPSSTGSPSILGLPLWPQFDFFCNFTVEYTDQPMSEVGCTRRFLRTWEVREWWCNEDDTRRCQQIITIVDTVGPVIYNIPDTIHAKVARRGCVAQVDLPELEIRDACNGVKEVDVVYPGGIIHTNGGWVNMPLGIDTVVYRAYDSCHNLTTDTLIVVARDGVPPVAVCEQNTVVSLNNRPSIKVMASTFDDGSFDECEIDRFEVRRMVDMCDSGTDEWGDYVEFCCDDVEQNIMVAFRVFDKSGNSSTCMINTLVQDKTPPQIIPLPDITVDCAFDVKLTQPNISVFGSYVEADSLRDSIIIDADSVIFSSDPLDGLVISNCPVTIIEEMDTSNLDNCGNGFLIRRFRFFDNNVNDLTTEQIITFNNPEPFDSTDIIWPEHLDTFNLCDISLVAPGALPIEHGFPRFIGEDECSLVGYDYKNEIIDASQGAQACYKIIRHWTVIDWCQKIRGEFRKWTYDQVILVENTIAPIITSECTDTVRCVYNVRCEPDTMVLIAEATDDCTPSDALFWRYKIDLDNDGDFNIIKTGNDATGLYPIGIHRIKFLVEDLCGNLDSCEYLFELRNCKAPTAYCKNGLNVELTAIDTSTPPDGIFDIEEAEVWARDFDDGSHHACGHGVRISFSADVNDTLRVYNCDSLVPPRREVTIWVTDTVTGQVSKCVNYVTVFDSNGIDVCPSAANGKIFGLVTTDDQEEIINVEVDLMGSGLNSYMTKNDGQFAFPNMPFGGDYDVFPHRNDDHENGVSTADLVAIRRHLLGLVKLDDPYKLIAADVNNSKSITARDISELRKLVLGLNIEFENNTSWRFVDKDYIFPEQSNPWVEEFPESRSVLNFSSDIQADFVGVKIGDVTGDVQAGITTKNKPRSMAYLQTHDQQFAQDELIEVPVEFESIEDARGMQFSLEWDTDVLEFIEIRPNNGFEFTMENFGMTFIDQGVITASWYSTEKMTLPKNLTKMPFSLIFKGKKSSQLSDVLMVTDIITKSEVYLDEELNSTALRLRFGQKKGSYFKLYQNEPNPWSASTTIRYFLPESDLVRLTIYNETGQTVYSIEKQSHEGLNELEIVSSVIGRSGLFYYEMKTTNYSIVKKMIALE